MGFRIKIVDQVIGAVTHLALLAVEERVGEGSDVAAGFPYTRVHEDVGIHFVAVLSLLDEALSPGVLHIVLQSGAEGAVVPGIGEAAVNITAGENETSGFAEGYDLLHALFFGLQYFVHD